MKISLHHLLSALVLSVAGLRAADDSAIAAVRAADDERVAATIASDRVRLDSIYSADLYYAHSSGKVDNKAEHVEGIAKRASAYTKFDYLRRDFKLIGPGIVAMTGRVVIYSTSANGKNANDVNFLALWREENGQWRFLAWQATKNPPAENAKK